MHRKLLFTAFLALLLSGPALLRAQQTTQQVPMAQSAAPGQKKPPEVQQFQGYEDQWSIATVNANQFKMENLLSPLFVDISSTGEVDTRSQLIVNLFQSGAHPVSMEQRVVSVRLFGDTAVVSGTYIMKWDNSGALREERGIFTHLWVLMRDRWRCVNSQRTAVVNLNPASASQKKNKAKSHRLWR
jgi:hypothetical protein